MSLTFRKNKRIVPPHTIILIGGAPCTGKTTVARKLSRKLRIQWFETDKYLKLLQRSIPADAEPALHTRGRLTVNEYYEKYSTPELAAEAELKRAGVTANYLKQAVLAGDITPPVIIEGIAVTPGLATELIQKLPEVKCLFLKESNAQHFEEIIRKRGIWAAARKYPSKFKRLEVDWCLYYQNELMNQLQDTSLTVVNVGDRSSLVERIAELVNKQ